MDYKEKYLKYKNKYLELKSKSYKYFIVNDEIIKEGGADLVKHSDNKITPAMIGAGLKDFNKFNKNMFRNIQRKSREEVIEDTISSHNTSYFKAASIYNVYNYLIENFDSINSKYITKQYGGEEEETEEVEAKEEVNVLTQPWYCDIELKLILETLPGIGVTSAILQFVCGKKLDAIMSLVGVILGTLLLPVGGIGLIPLGILHIYNLVKWWIDSSKLAALKAAEEKKEEEE